MAIPPHTADSFLLLCHAPIREIKTGIFPRSCVVVAWVG